MGPNQFSDYTVILCIGREPPAVIAMFTMSSLQCSDPISAVNKED